MPTAHPRKAGRPRGSAAVAAVLGYQLTSAEATPLRAGLRVARANTSTPQEIPHTLAGLSPYLMPHERQALAASGDDHFMRWYTIGLACTSVMGMIEIARRA